MTVNDAAEINGKRFKSKNLRVMFFSEKDFKHWFSMKSKDVLQDIEKKLKKVEDFGFDPEGLIPFDGINTYLLINQGKKNIVYSWNLPNGPWPLRWQETDDITDYVNSL